MRLTSIIIPSCNGLELLAACVESIRAYTASPYEIIVTDNGSADGTLEYCMREGLTFIAFADNAGFPAACNAGLKLAKGDALLLLNNDVVVSPNWLSNMLQCLEHSPDVGIVGPCSNYVSGRQQVEAGYSTMEDYPAWAAERNRPDPSRWQPLERLVGFCFLFKREVLDKIGYLDEIFSPGHYEDDDYCYRARQAGYRLFIAGDAFVHHHGSASFKKQDGAAVRELIERNHRKFIAKWGIDPRQYI